MLQDRRVLRVLPTPVLPRQFPVASPQESPHVLEDHPALAEARSATHDLAPRPVKRPLGIQDRTSGRTQQRTFPIAATHRQRGVPILRKRPYNKPPLPRQEPERLAVTVAAD